METKVLKRSAFLTLSAAAVFLLINWRVSAGMVLGLFVFNIYYLLLKLDIEERLRNNNSSRGTGKQIIRISILMIAPVLGLIFPKIFNFYGTIFGILSYKLLLPFTAYGSNSRDR